MINFLDPNYLNKIPHKTQITIRPCITKKFISTVGKWRPTKSNLLRNFMLTINVNDFVSKKLLNLFSSDASANCKRARRCIFAIDWHAIGGRGKGGGQRRRGNRGGEEERETER